MPTILQLRRGSTAENDVYTGSVGELTVDTTLNTVRVINRKYSSRSNRR